MSTTNYDSDFCGSLPLHNINLIQPYGYLLVLSKQDFTILQASENSAAILGKDIAELIGSPISNYIKAKEFGVLQHKFSSNITDKIPVSFTFITDGEPTEFNALVHAKSAYFIVELEKTTEKNTFIDVFQQLKFIMAEINLASSVKNVSSVAIKALKKLADFDRVLMYQFDEEWNGSVIAEITTEESDSYLGLKFPASDIPKQARALYHKNPYRLIPARDYSPVKLYPVINSATHTFTDLSNCNLRSVPAVHLEYMKNMGIQASMSIRVIYNDKLWGIISCHHQTPKYLNYELCSIFELLSEVLSSKISSIYNREASVVKGGLLDNKAEILEKLYSSSNVVTGLFNSADTLLKLFKSSGLSIIYKSKVESSGLVPAKEEILNLVFWLQSKAADKIFAETNLAAVNEQAAAYIEIGSGLLAIPIGKNGGDYLLLFKPEVQTTISWGGNPSEAINFEADGKKYHPRNSFKVWQEQVKQTSLSWKEEELEIAESLRSSIFEYSAKYTHN